MSNKYNSSNIQSITNKKIFLDANILIYLFGFGTPTSANWENQYATLYSKLNKQNNIFVVDYIVISEFVNSGSFIFVPTVTKLLSSRMCIDLYLM